MKQIDHSTWYKEEFSTKFRYRIHRLDEVNYASLENQRVQKKSKDGDDISKRIWDNPSYDPLWTMRSAEQYMYISYSQLERNKEVPSPYKDVKMR